jgi:hypothetical protein
LGRALVAWVWLSSAHGPARAAALRHWVSLPELHVPLREAARILGLAHGTLLNRLNRHEADELRAVKVFGRWKVPVSALRALLTATALPTNGEGVHEPDGDTVDAGPWCPACGSREGWMVMDGRRRRAGGAVGHESAE